MKQNESRHLLVTLLTAFLVAASVSAAHAEDTGIEPQGIYFGFTDSSGELILIHSPGQMDISGDLSAVMPSGEIITLESLDYRDEGLDNNHRQTTYNFDNLPGYLFRLPDGKITSGSTVLLAEDGFLEERILLSVTSYPRLPLEDELVARIEDIRGLPVIESWNLAEIEGGISIVIVRFEPGESTNTASLVRIDGQRMVFEDYIGCPMNDSSVWRADDGGVFDAANFDVIAAFHTSEGVEIVRTWMGAEGESAALLEENGPVFMEVLSGYRYWAPL